MRINMGNLLVGTGISGLLAYGVWSIDGDLKSYVGIGSLVYFLVTLGPAIGFNYAFIRNARVLRIVCALFFLAGCLFHPLYAAFGRSSTFYVVSTSVATLSFIFLANAIYSAEQ